MTSDKTVLAGGLKALLANVSLAMTVRYLNAMSNNIHFISKLSAKVKI